MCVCVCLCVCVCEYLTNPVSLPAASAAKHAGSTRGAAPPSCLPLPLCLSLACDWLLTCPADCPLSDTEREREGDGGDSDGVSCHFLFLYPTSLHPSSIHPLKCCISLLCGEWMSEGEGGGHGFPSFIVCSVLVFLFLSFILFCVMKGKKEEEWQRKRGGTCIDGERGEVEKTGMMEGGGRENGRRVMEDEGDEGDGGRRRRRGCCSLLSFLLFVYLLFTDQMLQFDSDHTGHWSLASIRM